MRVLVDVPADLRRKVLEVLLPGPAPRVGVHVVDAPIGNAPREYVYLLMPDVDAPTVLAVERGDVDARLVPVSDELRDAVRVLVVMHCSDELARRRESRQN